MVAFVVVVMVVVVVVVVGGVAVAVVVVVAFLFVCACCCRDRCRCRCFCAYSTPKPEALNSQKSRKPGSVSVMNPDLNFKSCTLKHKSKTAVWSERPRHPNNKTKLKTLSLKPQTVKPS